MGWQKVTKPKDEGGLGLQTTKGKNVFLLTKLNWRLSTKKEALWAKVLRQKYCNYLRERAINADKLPCSQTWATIKRGREVFSKGSMWMVSRGSNLSFWLGNWTKRGPIRHLIHSPLALEALHWEVKDVVMDKGWDWDKIPFDLPTDIKLLIQATPVSLTEKGSDRLARMDNPKGNFDLKSAYNIAVGSNSSQAFTANWIWKATTLPRIKTFLCKCTHESIRVKHCLMRKGVIDDDLCPICQREPETVLHALRYCSQVKAIWIQLGVKLTNLGFWMTNLQDWLNVNRNTRTNYVARKPPWNVVYSFAVWNIWMSRNNVVFNRKSQNLRLVVEITHRSLEFLYCVASPRGPT